MKNFKYNQVFDYNWYSKDKYFNNNSINIKVTSNDFYFYTEHNKTNFFEE